MNAYELANELEKVLDVAGLKNNRVPVMLRQQADRIVKYEQALQSIANERIELSHDKIKWQCEDHIRWAKEALSSSGNNDENESNNGENLPKGKL